ncbi:MAG: prepilin-type N-terminal cleavage/methylation domain-containing protein [Candidatus Omnitrophica bacterium]|nr:prepilin-type N-terminal cleavage/methylation domain-containing protein [Candidatus Omnitrophota bacterium]
MSKKRFFFTLIEVIVVIVVIVILYGIGAPVFRRAVEVAKDKEAENMLSLIASAQRMYRLKYNEYFREKTSDLDVIKRNLSVDLPVGEWNYEILQDTENPSHYKAIAYSDKRDWYWEITPSDDRPQKFFK